MQTKKRTDGRLLLKPLQSVLPGPNAFAAAKRQVSAKIIRSILLTTNEIKLWQRNSELGTPLGQTYRRSARFFSPRDFLKIIFFLSAGGTTEVHAVEEEVQTPGGFARIFFPLYRFQRPPAERSEASRPEPRAIWWKGSEKQIN